MGFDHVGIAPLFRPGRTGDVFLIGDVEAPHPALDAGDAIAPALARIVELAAGQGLKVVLDVMLDRVARDGGFAASHAPWLRVAHDNNDDLPDPRRPSVDVDSAFIRFDDGTVVAAWCEWWAERLSRWSALGIAGVRLVGAHRIPAAALSPLVATMRRRASELRLLASVETANRDAVAALSGLALDYIVSQDAITTVTTETLETLRRIAPVIALPERPFGPRLAARGGPVAALYRQALDLAALSACGILVPMGFEFAASRPLDPITSGPDDAAEFEREAPFDLSRDIAAALKRFDRAAVLDCGHSSYAFHGVGPVHAVLRTGKRGQLVGEPRLLIVTNRDVARPSPIDFALDPLPSFSGAALRVSSRLDGDAPPADPLAPGEVRALMIEPTKPIVLPTDRRVSVQDANTAPRIAIEALSPEIDGGRFAVKRVVGDPIRVEADIFADGHDALAAELLWRAADEADWRRVAMVLDVNDRWHAAFTPSRIGRHVFVVEAWRDDWASFRRDLQKKVDAGQDVQLDLAEGRTLLAAAAAQAERAIRPRLKELATADFQTDGKAALQFMLSETTADAVRAAGRKSFRTQSRPVPIDVDRPQASFSSWYELFPRSATGDAHRHGTFAAVEARLPAIRDMGFDVLYFPPIHPIGKTNRKGRNNALTAAPEDVGSVYAIGGDAGGHTAIHPALGALDDFRRLRDAASRHGLEIALDFAVQCSPDHPWLKEHRDWFRWRADGSLRYAENPPKTYEDIVNPDFYAEAALPDLWLALRDIIAFWVDEGIRIFRVDNPHTKPLPFWEWMIADIRARHPDVFFLAEAFTRPKLMYRLAKLGFSQSYTYFTWRHTKSELTDYMLELTRGPAKDFFRPNFFVNTPDINPYFLQRSGRPGFLIRAALAATLSGAWGMYSGFELCEVAPLPGREEYLDSEKYEIRVRNYQAPGNISAEIAALNRLRKAHPALQRHHDVTFYSISNDQILLFGKVAPDAQRPFREMILVFVNLDPYSVQDGAYELPLWEFGLSDSDGLAVEDLITGGRFTLNGKQQYMRLDPSVLPYAIWRLLPPARL